MINELIIGVTTVSFSSNPELIKKLENDSGAKVVINEKLKRFSREELIIFLSKCDGAIVGVDQIDDSLLAECPKLKVISKYGVGLDNIDLESCKKREIRVYFPSGINKRSVAEETLGFMLTLARNIFVTSNRMKLGEWHKNGGIQLTQKTVGIIGVGNIGKEVVSLLQPFRCRILVNDIIDQSEFYSEHGLIECSKEEIYREADFITIHTPKSAETFNMIDKAAIANMKPSVYIINTSRGGIVNQADLKSALKENKIAGAALDVFETEPLEDTELINIENIICTPHIGGNSREAVNAMGIAAIENLLEGLNSKWL